MLADPGETLLTLAWIEISPKQVDTEVHRMLVANGTKAEDFMFKTFSPIFPNLER